MEHDELDRLSDRYRWSIRVDELAVDLVGTETTWESPSLSMIVGMIGCCESLRRSMLKSPMSR